MQRITNDLFDKIRAVTHPQQLTEAKMDPVGKEDADVNNDGKKDKSDKYLLNRRKAISTAIKNEEANFNPAPEPEDRNENPTLNDKIREKAMQAAARISGMSGGPKVLSDIGPGAEVKEEAELSEGIFKREADAANQMNALRVAAKNKTRDGKLATAFHAHAMHALEKNDFKRIGKLHKAFKMVTEEESHQSKTTMKHIPNASPALKKAAKDIKPGIAGYRDRIDMLKAGGVKEEVESMDEATRNTEKRHIDSIIKMKEVKKSKHDMAPSIHDNMEDAFENGNHKKIDQLHKVFKHITEEIEELDEISLQTMKSAKEKLGSKALDAHYNDDKRSARNYAGRALHMDAKIKRKERSASSLVKEAQAGKRVAEAILAKLRKEEVELTESVTETIVRHNDFTIEITDNPTFADFFKAIQSLAGDTVTESEIVSMASKAFDVNAEDILIEDFTRMEIMDKHAAHRKAGNLVSHEKFSNKEGKPYAEYVVTDKEGGRKRYIHHGSTRRMESMASKK